MSSHDKEQTTLDYRRSNREILALALPSVVSNITVPLLGLADVAIVGHIGDSRYIGAIAIGSMIFNVAYWLFGFLRMGTSGMTAQAFGSGDDVAALGVLVRALTVGWGMAFLLLLFQVPLGVLALRLMNTPSDMWLLVSRYLRIVVWGAPAVLGMYGLMGWFVGMQNTRVPMFVSVFQNVVNIALSVLLVFVLGLGIEGVAMGTLFSQWAGMAVAMWMMLRMSSTRKQGLKWKSIVLRALGESAAMARFFSLNRDIFLRTLCLVAVNMFFTSAGARQGTLVLAVNTLLMIFFTLSSYVQDGFAFAGEALVGKYHGAANRRSLVLTVKMLFFWGAGIALAFSLCYVLFGSKLLLLLTSDRTTTSAAVDYLWWVYVVPLAGVAAFVYDGIFIGLTASRGMLLSCAVGAALFFCVFFVAFPYMENHALWLAFIVFLVMRGVVQSVIFPRLL